MGARIILRASPAEARRQRAGERKTLAGILLAIAAPCALMCALIAADLRSDLFELAPRVSVTTDSGAKLVGWRNLPHEAGTRIRLIGYMMDPGRPIADGSPVRTFLLMPDAGSFVHPAHRVPEEMIEVRVATPTAYRDRGLIWAEGTLSRTDRTDGGALYALSDAAVSRAREKDLARWFTIPR